MGTWYGALSVARLTQDAALERRLVTTFDRLRAADGPRHISDERHPVFLDRAALAMVAYLDSLQQPTGLFYHGIGSPFYWGRGNGWIALVQQLDADANVRDICVGTGKANSEVGSDTTVQYNFYVARPRRTGDLHGQAPVLWTAAALLR